MNYFKSTILECLHFFQNFAEFSLPGICKRNTNLLNTSVNSSQWGLCIFFFSLPEKPSVENGNFFQCRKRKRKKALQTVVLKWLDNIKEVQSFS